MPICGINAQLLTAEANYRRAGIHVYLLETLRNLPHQADLKFKAFTSSPPSSKEFETVLWEKTHNLTANPIGRILWEQMVWPIRAKKAGCHMLHGAAFSLPLFTKLPGVVTVFDLSFVHYPEIYPTWRRIYLNFITRKACSKAEHIIVISKSGKHDLIKFFQIDPSRISVIYPGVNPKFKRGCLNQINKFRQAKKLPSRFLLHVGTLQPRKNLPFLIKAFDKARLKGVDLVFAGGKGWYFDEIFKLVQTLGLEKRIHFLGYVSDEDLPLLYSAAEFLVFPSIYEGFGMPILEAMSCGTPVIASQTSAIPEAVGKAGLLFDPNNIDDLVQHLIELVENPERLDQLREIAPTHAAKFTWDKAGKQTAEIYKRVLQYTS